MAKAPIYDRIGRRYAQRRRPDPRIAARLHQALGDARKVVNVGAGSGSYEPANRHVVAVVARQLGQRCHARIQIGHADRRRPHIDAAAVLP